MFETKKATNVEFYLNRIKHNLTGDQAAQPNSIQENMRNAEKILDFLKDYLSKREHEVYGKKLSCLIMVRESDQIH
jgi:hypothetical protein